MNDGNNEQPAGTTSVSSETIKNEIEAAVDTVAGVASTIAPEYAPFIVLGQAVAHAIPSLYADVQALLQKKDPTDADTKALADKIAALQNPAAL